MHFPHIFFAASSTTRTLNSPLIPREVSDAKRMNSGTTVEHKERGARVTSDNTARTNRGIVLSDPLPPDKGQRRQASMAASNTGPGIAGQPSRACCKPVTSVLSRFFVSIGPDSEIKRRDAQEARQGTLLGIHAHREGNSKTITSELRADRKSSTYITLQPVVQVNKLLCLLGTMTCEA